MVIMGLSKAKIEELERALNNWKGYFAIDPSIYGGLYDITIEYDVPFILKYYGGEDGYTDIIIGNKIVTIRRNEMMSIEY